MGAHANKNPQCHKVAGNVNDETRMTNDESKPELPKAGIAQTWFLGFGFFRHSTFDIPTGRTLASSAGSH